MWNIHKPIPVLVQYGCEGGTGYKGDVVVAHKNHALSDNWRSPGKWHAAKSHQDGVALKCCAQHSLLFKVQTVWATNLNLQIPTPKSRYCTLHTPISVNLSTTLNSSSSSIYKTPPRGSATPPDDLENEDATQMRHNGTGIL